MRPGNRSVHGGPCPGCVASSNLLDTALRADKGNGSFVRLEGGGALLEEAAFAAVELRYLPADMPRDWPREDAVVMPRDGGTELGGAAIASLDAGASLLGFWSSVIVGNRIAASASSASGTIFSATGAADSMAPVEWPCAEEDEGRDCAVSNGSIDDNAGSIRHLLASKRAMRLLGLPFLANNGFIGVVEDDCSKYEAPSPRDSRGSA